MKIFPQEIKDGVADVVQSSASIAYCMPATLCKDTDVHSVAFAEKVKAESANPKQIDLYYLKSILVSTGWNKNDDVFLPNATWAARNTPEDKQFNFMHNENDIIGHITGSYVVDKNGNVIDSENAPEEFDIITEAVLYNSWTSPENRDRMQKIISEIEDGKWFVSMECLFSGFDYSLIDENGNTKYLERNEGSAFLTKHLRAYGGTGEYEGHKIGRCLRDISFSGKGLVSKPANPRSVILDASRASSNQFLTLGGSDMSDNSVLEQQLAEVRSELASAKQENDNLRAKIEETVATEQSEAIVKLEETLAQKEEAIKVLEEAVIAKEASITELQETLAMKEGEMSKKEEELMKMKKEKKMAARKASLVEAGFEDAEAEESLSVYETLDDEAFDSVIAVMKKKMAKWSEKKKEEKPMAEVKVEEEAVAEEVTEELFKDVSSTEATLVDASDATDELEATRASVAQWLENNVLRK